MYCECVGKFRKSEAVYEHLQEGEDEVTLGTWLQDMHLTISWSNLRAWFIEILCPPCRLLLLIGSNKSLLSHICLSLPTLPAHLQFSSFPASIISRDFYFPGVQFHNHVFPHTISSTWKAFPYSWSTWRSNLASSNTSPLKISPRWLHGLYILFPSHLANHPWFAILFGFVVIISTSVHFLMDVWALLGRFWMLVVE